MTSWLSFVVSITLILSSVAEAHDAVTSSGRLACNPTKLCTEADRATWMARREHADKIIKLLDEQPGLDPYSSAFSSELYKRLFDKDSEPSIERDIEDEREWRQLKVMAIREDLCFDKQSAGFFLRNGTEEWPIACVWTASDINGTCVPAPPNSDKFSFIGVEEWRKAVDDFRRKIRCPPETHQLTSHINELYICRDKCTQAGIGYMLSLFIMISMLLVIGALCF